MKTAWSPRANVHIESFFRSLVPEIIFMQLRVEAHSTVAQLKVFMVYCSTRLNSFNLAFWHWLTERDSFMSKWKQISTKWLNWIASIKHKIIERVFSVCQYKCCSDTILYGAFDVVLLLYICCPGSRTVNSVPTHVPGCLSIVYFMDMQQYRIKDNFPAGKINKWYINK